MKIALLYNISDRLKTGHDTGLTADEDIPGTLRAVEAAFRKRHEVLTVRFSAETIPYLQRISADAVFNLCEGMGDINSGEAFAAALLEASGIPYTGSDFYTLALCMDKLRTKEVLSFNGLPTPPFQLFRSSGEQLRKDLNFPLILKPVHEDASIGIDAGAVVYTPEELAARIGYITERFRQPALAEEYIEGRELNVSIIGNPADTSNDSGDSGLEVLPVSEILFHLPKDWPRIVGYEAKWEKTSVYYHNTPAVCPADLHGGLLEAVRDVSRKAYIAAGCRDYARVDIRLRDNVPYIIEVNPNPGKYLDSGFVRSAAAAGMDYEALCSRLVECALERCGKDTSGLYLSGPVRARQPAGERETGAPGRNRLTTSRLTGTPVSAEDLPLLVQWFNDPVTGRFMDDPGAVCTGEELMESLLLSKIHEADFLFRDRASGVPVGFAALYHVNYQARSGEISFLIGDSGFLGRGFGSEIVSAVCTAAFELYSLESVFVSIVTENTPSCRAVERNGFQRIGIRRQSHASGDMLHDEYLYDLLKTGFLPVCSVLL